jgi:ribonuclease P protein component
VAVYKSGKSWGGDLIWMKALPNGLKLSRYGFSVTKSVGKAVVRNRVRRLLREIVRLKSLRPGWDIVFVSRPSAATADYHQLDGSISRLLGRVCLLQDKDEKNGNRVD